MQAAKVLRARDCGAGVVLAKPQPAVLSDRLAWLARGRQAFIDVPACAGPTGASSSSGRHEGDVPANLGPAKEPDMPQGGIGASPLAAMP